MKSITGLLLLLELSLWQEVVYCCIIIIFRGTLLIHYAHVLFVEESKHAFVLYTFSSSFNYVLLTVTFSLAQVQVSYTSSDPDLTVSDCVMYFAA